MIRSGSDCQSTVWTNLFLSEPPASALASDLLVPIHSLFLVVAFLITDDEQVI